MVPILTPDLYSSYSISGFTSYINHSSIEVIANNFYESYKEAIDLSDVSMYCTNSFEPTGNESGTCLVVDLGGSNLRIGILQLEHGKHTIHYQKRWSLAESDKLIDLNFFDRIAQKVNNIPNLKYHFKNETVRVGISWSFPLEQSPTSQTILKTVGKGFRLSESTFGGDLRTLFEDSFKANGIDGSVESIINDSVAVFLAGNYLSNSIIGLVVGTGVNCSLAIDAQLFGKEKSLRRAHSLPAQNDKKVVLNSELGFFGAFLCRHSTIWDSMIHENWALHHSIQIHQPHMTLALGCFQPIEMMCSGRYIGELTRLVVLSLIGSKQIFKEGQSMVPSRLDVPYCLTGKTVCEMYESKCHFPEELWAPFVPSQEDRQVVVEVIDSIIERASVVLACAIIGLLKLSESSVRNGSTKGDSNLRYQIGYVGSVLNFFSSYREKVEDVLEVAAKLHIIDRRVSLIYVNDSNLVGTAVSIFTG